METFTTKANKSKNKNPKKEKLLSKDKKIKILNPVSLKFLNFVETYREISWWRFQNI